MAWVIDSAVPNYQTGNAHKLRARIRLARDDVAGAESDAEIAIALVRRIGEFQVVAPALAEASLVAAALGRESDALALVDELIELDRPRPVRARSTTTGFYVPFALAAVEVGRASEFLEVTANVEHPSPWLTAGRAYARGELGAAVELLSRLSVPDTAWARLRAARPIRARFSRSLPIRLVLRMRLKPLLPLPDRRFALVVILIILDD